MEAAFSRLTMTAASVMLLLTLVVVWRRHATAYITAFRTQSIALAFVGTVVAWYGHVPELFGVAAMILVLKGWIVPRVLSGMEARRQGARLPPGQPEEPAPGAAPLGQGHGLMPDAALPVGAGVDKGGQQ